MQGTGYQRATRRHPAVIDHNDGDQSKGFLLVPIGVSLQETLSQAHAFLPFETPEGAMTYVAMTSIKRVTPQQDRTADEEAAEAEEAIARSEANRRAEAKARADTQREAAQKAREEAEAHRTAQAQARARRERERQRAQARPRPQQPTEPMPEMGAFSEELIARRPDILRHLQLFGLPRTATWSEIQSAYRRLAKEHHPDRMRGMGASQAQIEEAAARLLDINDAYRALSSYNIAA